MEHETQRKIRQLLDAIAVEVGAHRNDTAGLRDEFERRIEPLER